MGALNKMCLFTRPSSSEFLETFHFQATARDGHLNVNVHNSIGKTKQSLFTQFVGVAV